jgi:site-specific recombinase XerD
VGSSSLLIERHRKIDVTSFDVSADSVGDEDNADQNQKGEGEHFDGRMSIHESARSPLSRSVVCKMVNTFAEDAGLSELNVHPHMLRHACGYDLANRGADTRLIQDYLGHQNIQHTVRYTELSPTRFANLY